MYEFKLCFSTTLTDDYDKDDVISTTTASNGKEKLFNEAESIVIQEICGEIIKNPPITKTRIQDSLNESKKGQSILQRFTINQLINKVKYERRLFLAKNK